MLLSIWKFLSKGEKKAISNKRSLTLSTVTPLLDPGSFASAIFLDNFTENRNSEGDFDRFPISYRNFIYGFEISDTYSVEIILPLSDL